MRKLGKKEHEMLETVEAYCTCNCDTSCECTCYCSIYTAPQAGLNNSADNSRSSSNKYALSQNLTSAMVYK